MAKQDQPKPKLWDMGVRIPRPSGDYIVNIESYPGEIIITMPSHAGDLLDMFFSFYAGLEGAEAEMMEGKPVFFMRYSGSQISGQSTTHEMTIDGDITSRVTYTLEKDLDHLAYKITITVDPVRADRELMDRIYAAALQLGQIVLKPVIINMGGEFPETDET